jgi:DnaJ-class molecular chaperone
MPTRDPYELFGVSREASGEDVRKAYRRLAGQHHPDTNANDPGAEERFKEIQQAYEVLSDPDKRRKHDERSRTSSKRKRGGPRAGTGGSPGSSNASQVNLADLLGNLSGKRTGGHKESGGRLRGNDVTRIARLLGVDLDRLSKLLGESTTMRAHVTFGHGEPGTSGPPSWPGKRPPEGKHKKPPIPPRTV